MKRIRHLWILCLALATGTFVACVNDPLVDGPIPPANDGTMELRLNVVIPENSPGGSATRSISATEENTIQSVSVLAFRIDGANETYDYQTTATLAPNNVTGSTTQTFIANLRAQSYQQRFVVVTNAASLVGAQTGAVSPGMAKARVLSFLEYDFATNQDRWAANSSNNYTSIPMWGESAAETITSTTRQLSATIPLMRMVARMDVRLNTATAGITDRFKLRSVRVYNTNRGGRMVPDAANVTTTQETSGPYVRATSPTIPTSFQPYSSRTLGPITYTDFTAPGVTDVSMNGAIYLFETAAATTAAEATCIVVGGVYGTDTSETFYRVELYAAGTQTRLNILRNYRYIVNINDVQGRGYPTAEQAFNAPPVNMAVQVLQWSRPGMDNIAFNNTNWLASDKETVNLWSNEYTTAPASDENVVLVSTDVQTGWTLGAITNGDGTGTASWVRISPTSGGTGVSDVVRVTISVDANTGTAPRTAIINLNAGRLRLPIRIVQSNQPAIALTVTDTNNQEIQELVFSAPAGVAPSSQQFVVNWMPAGNPVNVPTVTQIGQYEFPNPGGNPAVQDGAPYLNMPWPERTGARTFTVSPPALTAAELAANPFIAKSSRFEFTVGNGFTQLTRRLILRQLWYNLRVEPDPLPMFTMDGQRYGYNVRSNTTWRIRSVVETPRVAGTQLIAAPSGLDNVYAGATGGPVTTPNGGWRESLTTNNSNRGGSGYADVTYESDKDPAQFQPVTRRLFFPSANFNIFSICLMNSNSPDARNYSWWSGSGPNQPPMTDHDVQTMTNGTNNYGTIVTGTGTAGTFSSTVPVRGIGTYGLWVGGSSSAATDGRSYSGTTVTTAMVSAAVNVNADMLIISGDSKIPFNGGTTTAEAQAIYDNFLAKDKPVLLFTDDINSVLALFIAIRNGGRITGNMSASNGQNGNAAVYRFSNISDPILEGPFRDSRITGSGVTQNTPNTLQGVCWGVDGAGTTIFSFTDGADAGVITYANANDQSNTTTTPSPNTTYPMFRFRNVPLVVVGDGGFLASSDQGNTTSSPTVVNTSTKAPDRKNSYGGNSSNTRFTYNAMFVANTVAWAIQRRTTQ